MGKKALRPKDIEILRQARDATEGGVSRNHLVEAFKRAGASAKVVGRRLYLTFEENTNPEGERHNVPVGNGHLDFENPHAHWRDLISDFARFLLERNNLD